MDFIAGRQFSKEEIYQILGVPAGLLDKNATEANATTSDKVFKEKTIWPVMCMLSEQLTAQLIVPLWGPTQEAGFDDIRPANRELELREVTAANGILTIDEKRQKYWQLPALPNGEGAGLGSSNAPALLPAPVDNTMLKAAEIKRWETHAIRALKHSGQVPPFHTEYVEPEEIERIQINLKTATTPAEVKAAFAKQRIIAPSLAEGELQAALADYLAGLETRVNTELKKTVPNAAA